MSASFPYYDSATRSTAVGIPPQNSLKKSSSGPTDSTPQDPVQEVINVITPHIKYGSAGYFLRKEILNRFNHLRDSNVISAEQLTQLEKLFQQSQENAAAGQRRPNVYIPLLEQLRAIKSHK